MCKQDTVTYLSNENVNGIIGKIIIQNERIFGA